MQIKNYFNADLNKVAIYDVLPHVGDTGRRISGASESQFSNTLLGPLTLTVNDQDVTSRFDIYYRTDRYPSMDADTEMNSSQWVTTPADYSKVTALKIVSKDNSVLKSYETLHVIVDMQAPSYDPDNELFGKTATNTFKVQYDGTGSYGETSPVTNILRERIRIPVTKTWIGPKGEAVTVKLLADNNDSGKTVTLSKDNNWSATFEGLPKYKADGSEIAYKVTEAEVTGVDASKYTTTVTGSAAEGFTITNTNKETIDIQGSKTWDDDENRDGARPDSITVRLHADGVEKDAKTVTADDNWTWSFEGLPKYDSTDGHEISYILTEDAVAGYATTTNNYDVKNSYTPGKTSVTVTKAWNDANNKDGLRPDSIKVQLYANGKPTGDAVVLSAADQWTYTWTGLFMKENGKNIKYSVKEVTVPKGYEFKVTGDATSGFVIENTHEPAENQPPKKKDSPKKKLAQTGVSANMLLLAALAGAGIAALGVAGAMRRKQD